MSFDISRSTFRPRKNFLGVVMQQGRVQLDSDWNEWQSEFLRRIQAGTLDAIGQAVYPASTPNAFEIKFGTDSTGATILTIGAGRYYVDGLVAENHGPQDQASWDPALAELSGAPAFSTTSALTDYAKQPHLPGLTLPTSGIYLAYLDVWQRDVTYLEDPHLVDPAVNIDTTGRFEIIWQVKLLDLSNLPTAPGCQTDIPDFDQLERAPAGRLSTGVVPNAGSGPCCLAPNTGFTGQENQLYRVEIHSPGATSAPPTGGYTYPLPAQTPTFKWSRDNASIETSVSNIATASTSSGSVSQLTVGSLGRDRVLGFRVNDWIEITDDVYELIGQPGEVYQITSVVPTANLITLNAAVSNHFSVGGTTPKLHTRICRWDQSGKINSTDSAGNTSLWIDLGAANSNGQIPIPPPGTTLVLENGITVSFDLSPEPTTANPTTFRSGDYWLFAARTADGSVDILTAAPPLGIHHHYARLAIVTFPNTVQPCRVEWPPSESGCNCACTVTVSVSDLTANNTLQSIVDKYQNRSAPTTICLTPGIYALPRPLRLTSAHSNITIEACPPRSVRVQALAGNESNFGDGLVVLDNTTNTTVSGIDFVVPAALFSATSFAGIPITSLSSSVFSLVRNLAVSIGIRIVGATNTLVEDCIFSLAGGAAKINETTAFLASGLLLNGKNDGLEVRRCIFEPANVKFVSFRESFFAGITMASSVSFASSSTPSSPSAPTGLIGTVANVATTLASAGKVASKTRSAKTTVATKAAITHPAPVAPVTQPAAKANAVTSAARALVADPGLQMIGGQLQNVSNFGSSAAASTLASRGGRVLASSLAQGVVRENTFRLLTASALMLGETTSLDISDNHVENCHAGFWIITPSETQDLLRDPQSVTLLGATIALSLALPEGDTSSLVTVPAAPAATRIFTGKQNYTDPSGNVWIPDTAAASVSIVGGKLNIPATPPDVGSTNTPTLYQAERLGPSFSYSFTKLPAGFYSLTLKFAEIVYTESKTNKGIRIFDVAVNGQHVLSNLNIVAAAGAALTAYDVTFSNIASNNGQIVVQFTGTTQSRDHNAKISAAELDPTWSGAPLFGTGNESDSVLFFDQLAQLAWQGYMPGPTPALVRVQDNEMEALRAPGFLLLGDDSVTNGNASSLIMTGNRVEGEVSLNRNFATFAGAELASSSVPPKAKARLNLEVPTGIIIERAPSTFYYMVAASLISRAAVSSNIIVSVNTAGGSGPALLVSAVNTLQPSLAVTGNVLVGSSVVQP